MDSIINVTSVENTSYAFTIKYNGFESEITIHCSSGQSGKTAIVMILMSCDMGAEILLKCIDSQAVSNDAVVNVVRGRLVLWIEKHQSKMEGMSLDNIMERFERFYLGEDV